MKSIGNPKSSDCFQSDMTPINSIPLLSLKSVLLHDWWLLKADGNRIAVAGFASRESLGNRVFVSAPISRRIDATTLETIDSIAITVSGFINRSQTHQNGIPSLICNRFQFGFPYDWEDCVAQCYGEESGKRDVPTEKEPSHINAFPFSLDNLSATRLRDLVMCSPRDSANCAHDVIFGKFRGNTYQHAPLASHSNMENEVEETARSCKNARTDKMQRDDNNRTLDPKETQKLTQSKGVVTRSMYRLRNHNKLEEKHSSNSSTDGGMIAELATPVADKNPSRVAGDLQASPKTMSSRPRKKVNKTTDTSTVRSSTRLKIRKNYRELST